MQTCPSRIGVVFIGIGVIGVAGPLLVVDRCGVDRGGFAVGR